MQVVVKFNNIDFALRHLKRKVQKEGIPHVLRMKRYYQNPSTEEKNKRKGALGGMYRSRSYKSFDANSTVDGKISAMIAEISQLGAHSPVESSRASIDSVVDKTQTASHESIVVRQAPVKAVGEDGRDVGAQGVDVPASMIASSEKE